MGDEVQRKFLGFLPWRAGRGTVPPESGDQLLGQSCWKPLDRFLSVTRYDVHHGTALRQATRLAIRTPPTAWSYAVSFPCRDVALDWTPTLLIRVNLLVQTGRAAIGALHADQRTFLTEREVSADDGPCTVELVIRSGDGCERVMVRNAALDGNSSSILVEGIFAYASGLSAATRSGGPKDPFVDQIRLSGAPVRTVVDVGANVGDTVARYREAFPEATVYALEPTPTTFKQMTDRFSHDPHVKAFRLALGEASGTLNLHCFENHATNSMFPFVPEGRRFVEGQIREQGTISVLMERLDAFCTEQGIDRIDILKLDVQGGEAKVLDGARTMFQAGRVGIVFMEANFVPLYSGQAEFHELMGFLQAYGFRLFDIYDVRRDDTGRMKWCDALFIWQQ